MNDWWRKGYEAYHNAGEKKPWVKEENSVEEGKSDGVPYMGQHGATGTYNLPGKGGKAVEKFSTTLKPPAAEFVCYEYNKWANAGAIAAKGVATAATSALPAAASTPASIALMAYGDEPK